MGHPVEGEKVERWPLSAVPKEEEMTKKEAHRRGERDKGFHYFYYSTRDCLHPIRDFGPLEISSPFAVMKWIHYYGRCGGKCHSSVWSEFTAISPTDWSITLLRGQLWVSTDILQEQATNWKRFHSISISAPLKFSSVSKCKWSTRS